MSDVTLIADGDFTIPEAVTTWKTEAPFEGDAGRYVGRQDFEQLADHFSPIALNTPHPLYGGYYLVEETALEPVGLGDVVHWTRVYAQVPAARSDFESFAATLPGLSGSIDAYHRITSGTNAGTETTIVTEDSLILGAGDRVIIVYDIDVFDLNEQDYKVEREINSITSATSFKVDKILANGSPRYKYLIMVNPDNLGRAPEVKSVASRMDKIYYLPGITTDIATVDDIPVLNPAVIKTPFNQVTDTYTPDTDPPQIDYADLVNDGTWVVAEATVFRRWKGNIIEASTRYIVAQ